MSAAPETRCLVVVGGVQGLAALRDDDLDFGAYGCVICGDSGQDVARELGLAPDVFIGDFDSSTRPVGTAAEVIVLPTVKDLTDSEAAVDLAYARGFRVIDVIGGLGGRLDHTLGNLGILAKYQATDARLRWIDGYNMVSLVGPGTYTVARNSYHYFGLIPFDGDVVGLTVAGTRYVVSDFTLLQGSTRGVSNEIVGDAATVSFTGGRLLMVSSRDLDVSLQ